jgi:carbon-monoxide dehydrogenase medium subunit
MIAQEFEYTAPQGLAEALTLVANGAKPLAGGMSLIPMMKLRLAAPDHLVDMGRIPELKYIREEGPRIRIGAMSTHFELQTSPVLLRACAVLAKTAAQIGDVQVRNTGTIGGSIAHADPAADYPAALMALEADVRLVSASGERTLPISEFLLDSFTTAIDPGEIIAEIIVPADDSRTGTAYVKIAQAASGFALVGVAARVRKDGGRISLCRVGITGAGPIGYRASGVEIALEGKSGTSDEIAQAAAAASEGVQMNSDLNASAEYRAHLARVCTARAIRAALAELG